MTDPKGNIFCGNLWKRSASAFYTKPPRGRKRVGGSALGRIGVWLLGFLNANICSLVSMKPITWLRKIAKRRKQGYPVATLVFYGPDDKKASKAVLGIIPSEGAEPQLHKWFRQSPTADLRYDTNLQNAWIEIIRREGVGNVAMIEEINGCPHEEGVDYPVGEPCPECPFWADRQRPIESPPAALTAIATYRPDQWDTLRAVAADRDSLDETWEKWNARIEQLIAGFEAKGLAYVCVQLDVEEIEQYCKEEGIPNDSKARSKLAILKAEKIGW
jgi:hypothetical protein